MKIKDELINELTSNKISVKWEVSSEIGPEWIGSKREICFYRNAKPMDDNLAHSFLKESLIEKLKIPDKSEGDIIEGEGDLFVLANNINITYTISYTIPYDYPHKHENGEVVLISE